MFIRRELKENAKELLRKTYGMGVAVTLLFGLIGGSVAGVNVNFNFGSMFGMSSYTTTGVSSVDEGTYNMNNFEQDIEMFAEQLTMFVLENGLFLLAIATFVSIISFLFGLFVGNPLYVGFRRWYLENRQLNSEIGTIGTVFSAGYLNIVKVMFCTNLVIGLWSLLFVIPGIIKKYQYRMVPFLLAENQHMGVREAMRRSRDLMKGNKFEAFLLDLSFIGWGLLSGCLCGLLSILYVAPYIQYTEAELYVKLCQKENYTKPGIMKEEVISYSDENTY